PDTAAFPNQLQSVVIRGESAYLPNIAASPTGPLRFSLDTHAFVNVIGGANSTTPRDFGALNLHLGARDPETNKAKIFFANPWAMAFTSQIGEGTAYAVSAASDLLVKVNVAADGRLSFTVDGDTTRYIDLNDPTTPSTSGANAGKNPQGIAITSDGTRAYVVIFVMRNVALVYLLNYLANFHEVEDFEANIRNVSGPGNLSTPINGNALNPNQGLLIGNANDLNVAPSPVNAFTVPNANRPQVSVTLPGSANKEPALTALREWVRNAVRTPNSPAPGLPNGPSASELLLGRQIFFTAGCGK